MAFTEDVSVFFNTDDFAITVTIGGASYDAIFDNPTDGVELYDTQIEATDASMLVQTAGLSISRNATVVANGINYKVARWQRVDDGKLTRVFLNKV